MDHIRLEQAIRAKVHHDDKMRQVVCDIMGEGPAYQIGPKWGTTEDTVRKWRAGATPTLRLARKILDMARKRRLG